MSGGADPGRALHASLSLLAGRPTGRAAGIALTRTGRPPGEAPPLLLVHGLGSARTVWAAMLAPLAERFDVVAADLPGHGESEPLPPGGPRQASPAALAGRLAAACAALGLDRPHLMGNSLGGWIGLELAADGRLASCTALAPAGLRARPGRPGRWLRVNRRLALLTGDLADPLLASSAVRRLTLASASTHPERLDADLVRAAARAVRRASGYEVVLAAATGLRFARRDAIDVPVTVVFGDTDRILPGPGDRYRDAVPGHTRWIVLPDCGHAPMWDAPQACLRLLETETIAATR